MHDDDHTPELEKPQRRRRRWLPSMPRWFRRYFFWVWLSLLMLIALLGYLRYAISGNWTPDHLLRVLPLGGVF